jgi:hypothetical protein
VHTEEEFELGRGGRYSAYTEWTEELKDLYENPPRALVPGEVFCKKCRTIHAVPEGTQAKVTAGKASGKSFSLTCKCGNKVYL